MATGVHVVAIHLQSQTPYELYLDPSKLFSDCFENEKASVQGMLVNKEG